MTTQPDDAVPASIAELVRAYLAADYRWQHGGDWHELHIGLQAPALELLYPDHGTFGMLSAWNPRSVECTEPVNRDADRRLREELAALDLPFLPAFGSGPDRSWREPGWVVMGMNVDKFDALSRKYGQLSTLWWTYGQAGRLRVDASRPADIGDDTHVDWLRKEPAAG